MNSTDISKKRPYMVIIGSLVFFVLNVLLPFMRILFGFLESSTESSTTSYYPTGMKLSGDERDTYYYDIDFYIKAGASNVEFIWTLLDLWQWIFIFGGIAALILVISPEVVSKTRGKLPELPPSLGLIGFIIGIIASGVEWLLFILVWMLEDWVNQPDLGIGLMILNIIGFVALYLAAKPSLLIKEQVNSG